MRPMQRNVSPVDWSHVPLERTFTRSSTMTSLWSLGELSAATDDSTMNEFVKEADNVQSGKYARHSEFYFSDGSLVVLVEDTLFRIFASTLSRHSRFFAHVFESSRLPGEPPAGFSDNHPLKFEDVATVDFERLLRILYPQDLMHSPSLTAPECISILRLATQWDFPALRTRALQQLQDLPLPPVDKIVLSRKYGVRARWALDAYVELCEREESLSLEEAGRLGLEVAMGVMHLRERVQGMKGKGSSRSRTRRDGRATPSVAGSPGRVGSRRNTLMGPLDSPGTMGLSPMHSPPRSAGGGGRQRQRHSVIARMAAQTFGLDLEESD